MFPVTIRFPATTSPGLSSLALGQACGDPVRGFAAAVPPLLVGYCAGSTSAQTDGGKAAAVPQPARGMRRRGMSMEKKREVRSLGRKTLGGKGKGKSIA